MYSLINLPLIFLLFFLSIRLTIVTININKYARIICKFLGIIEYSLQLFLSNYLTQYFFHVKISFSYSIQIQGTIDYVEISSFIVENGTYT